VGESPVCTWVCVVTLCPLCDLIVAFVKVTTCNLEDIFVSTAGMVKKRYRTRQSTGNWKRDELTSVEKVRYRRDMGY